MPSLIPISLQMYTVRDDAARDFAATIAEVARIGYAAVELAGYGSAETAAVARQILDDHGLIASGAHVGLEVLESDLPAAIEAANTLGAEFVIVPYLAGERRASLDAYRQTGVQLDEIGGKLKDAGLTLCYHNHDFEFNKFDGNEYGYDALFAAADPANLKVEMDSFWVKKAGEDPAAYLEHYAGRVPLVHLKDMTPDGNFAEVGEGTMDFPAIFAAAPTAGIQFYVVEQDRCDNHAPLESIRISFENLKKMGMVA